MDYERALISAADGKALLFTGAGFSLGATSLNGNEFPMGKDLARELCRRADLPLTDDLKTASNHYLKVREPDELIEFLKSTFTVKKCSDAHRLVAKVPWKAVYTTNYDDAMEIAGRDSGRKYTPITLGDEPRLHRDSTASVVHINGFIDRLTSVTLLTEFKLTNVSYLTEQFRKSEWCDLFLHQLRSAQAIFFAGYSLYDLDIQEILSADRSLREKTFFIQKDGMTEQELFFSDLRDFGTILPIGIEKFGADLNDIDPVAINSDKSLVLVGLDEVKLPASPDTATAEDVYSLLLRGESDLDLLFAQQVSGKHNAYLFERDGQTRYVANARNYMVVGDLGNGKTTLLRALSAAFLKDGRRCFWVKDETYECHDEIDAVLKLQEPVVIVFDNYTRKLPLIEYVNFKRREDTSLVFAARTLLHKNAQEDLYYKKVRIDVSRTVEIDCNKLSEAELDNLSIYFSTFGLWGTRAAEPGRSKLKYFRGRCNSELHAILLDLLASPDIRARFSSLFGEFDGSREVTKTLIATFCLNLINITQPSAHIIAAITGDGTVFSPAFKLNSVLKQFFNSDRDVITPKSPALAEFCLKNFPKPLILVDCLIEICTATRKKADTERKFEISKYYWDIYRDMASFSTVRRMLPDHGKRELLIRFYEGLRPIALERENPLFWLQYAMARMDQPKKGDLEQAARYLDTAFALAKAKKNFTTVDIETQQARLFLEHALHTANSATEAYAYFMQANARLAKITKEEIYKSEPYRTMHNFEQFYAKFGSHFDDTQCKGLYDAFDYIMQNIKKLPQRVADEPVIIRARRIIREALAKLDMRLRRTG